MSIWGLILSLIAFILSQNYILTSYISNDTKFIPLTFYLFTTFFAKLGVLPAAYVILPRLMGEKVCL